MEQREVTIKTVGFSKRTPPELRSGITKKIGAAWEAGTSNLLMGLDEIEREVILPSIIRVNPSSTNWEEAVKDFYANLTIPVDSEIGKTLVISTQKKEVVHRGQKIEFDMPIRPMDYIMYKQCIVSKKVAKSEAIAKGEGRPYYIEDKFEAKAKQAKVLEIQDKIDRQYLKLTERLEDGKFKDVILIESVLRILGTDPRFIDDEDKIKELSKFRDEDKKIAQDADENKLKFLPVVINPKTKDRGFVLACLSYQVFEKLGDYVVEAGKTDKIIGKDIDSAITYLTDPANGSDLLRYKDLVKSRRETVVV